MICLEPGSKCKEPQALIFKRLEVFPVGAATKSWKSTGSKPVRQVQRSLRSGILRGSCDEIRKANHADCKYPGRPHHVRSTFMVLQAYRSQSAWLAISDTHRCISTTIAGRVPTDVLHSLSATHLRRSPRTRQHLAKFRLGPNSATHSHTED